MSRAPALMAHAFRPLVAAIAGLTLANHAGAADSLFLWQDDPWNLDWDERLAAQTDASLFPGFSRHPRPTKAGQWGGFEADLIAGSTGQASRLPDGLPIYGVPEGRVSLAAAAAGDHWFIQGRTDVLFRLSGNRATTPNGEGRAIWTGSDPQTTWSEVELIPLVTAGTWGFGHVLAVSNEPFRWGDGIFGGTVVSQNYRGFPHLVLTPIEPWNLGDSDWYVSYEAIGGLLDDNRGAVDNPWLLGYRVALRNPWLTVSGALAVEGGGGGAQTASAGDTLRLLWPGAAEQPAANGVQPNRIVSGGLRLTPGDRFAFSGEYTVDDSPTRTRNLLHPFNSAWTVTLDWLDITGDSNWRTALEWFRSESQFYDDPLYAWDYRDSSIGHPDGGNASSVRWLLQSLPFGEDRFTSIVSWRRLGWRSADTDNPNGGLQPSAQTPGGPLFAPVAWDRYAWDLHYEYALSRGALLIDLELAYDRNRQFVPDDHRWSTLGGIGWKTSW